jgi:hypothetical protein
VTKAATSGSNQKNNVAILAPQVLGRRQFELLALYIYNGLGLVLVKATTLARSEMP